MSHFGSCCRACMHTLTADHVSQRYQFLQLVALSALEQFLLVQQQAQMPGYLRQGYTIPSFREALAVWPACGLFDITYDQCVSKVKKTKKQILLIDRFLTAELFGYYQTFFEN